MIARALLLLLACGVFAPCSQAGRVRVEFEASLAEADSALVDPAPTVRGHYEFDDTATLIIGDGLGPRSRGLIRTLTLDGGRGAYSRAEGQVFRRFNTLGLPEGITGGTGWSVHAPGAPLEPVGSPSGLPAPEFFSAIRLEVPLDARDAIAFSDSLNAQLDLVSPSLPFAEATVIAIAEELSRTDAILNHFLFPDVQEKELAILRAIAHVHQALADTIVVQSLLATPDLAQEPAFFQALLASSAALNSSLQEANTALTSLGVLESSSPVSALEPSDLQPDILIEFIPTDSTPLIGEGPLTPDSLENLESASLTLNYPEYIVNLGGDVGFSGYTLEYEITSLRVISVPEPSGLLLAAGLAALALQERRRSC